MRRQGRWWRVALVWWLLAAAGAASPGAKEPPALGPDLSSLAARLRPAVGALVTFDGVNQPLSQGTAFLVRANGVVLTCYHVVEEAASALLRMENGAFFSVQGVLATDPARDLALLKVEGKNLPTVPLGDSSRLQAGQRVFAITSPEGLENTVADGLISAVRELPSGPLLQVSVPLSQGSSGGPIFDLSGQVVGVAAVVLTEGQALNFAVPINAAKPLLARAGQVKAFPRAEQPEDLDAWLRHRPSSPGASTAFDLWLRAIEARLDERDEAALGYLRAALAREPTFYQAHCCLGETYGKLGRYQEAIAEYKEALRLKPDYAEAHNNLGVEYGELGRDQEAIAEYKEALRLKPDYAEAHHNLAVEYGKLGRDQEAIAEYKEALRLKPDLAEAHYGLGLPYVKLGRDQEAIAEFKEALRLEPDLAEAHLGLGITYLTLGDRGAALEEHRILKDLDAERAAKLFQLLYP